MELEAQLLYWSPTGMTSRTSGAGTAYVTRREAERLCEEAHERGRKVGLTQAVEEVLHATQRK